MLIYKPYELPPTIKAAADCFATVVDCEGVTSAILMVSGGGLSYLDVTKDEEPHFLKWINSVCFELEEVEKWDAPTTNH